MLPGRFLQYECAGSHPTPPSSTDCGCLNLGVPVVLQRTVVLGDTTSGDSATVCLVAGRLGRDLGIGSSVGVSIA